MDKDPAKSSQKSPPVLEEIMNFDRLSKAIVALVELVQRLREPDGCPWDKKQTASNIKLYLLEEAYEVLAAIELSPPQEVCSELGDLLFQILFLAQLAIEKNQFDFVDVVEIITEKMIRRHPHVFGQKKVDSAEEVTFNWTQIKKAEKNAANDISGLLESIPMDLPALLRAHRLSERASKVGFDWTDTAGIWDKVREEFDEVGSAVAGGEREEVAEELGDLLFSVVNLCRHKGLNAEDILRMANIKFQKRFKEMEKRLEATGTQLEEASLGEMNEIWDKIKDHEGQ